MGSLAALPATGTLILDAFITQLEAQNVTLPSRRYVSPTPVPVWDGEQVTVALMGISQGQPGAGFGGTYVPQAAHQFAQFSVSIVRKVSALQTDRPMSSTVPTAKVMNKDGLQTFSDSSALWTAALTIKQANAQAIPGTVLLAGPGEGFEIGPLQTLGPEGGLSAARLLLSLNVD